MPSISPSAHQRVINHAHIVPNMQLSLRLADNIPQIDGHGLAL